MTVHPDEATQFAAGTIKLRRGLDAAIRMLKRWGGPLAGTAEFDRLSDRQLEELGMIRSARRAQWIDGRESHLPQNFDYEFRRNWPAGWL